MPSSNLLKYNNTNHLLLSENNIFTECCCGDDIFWEAVPCDAFLIPTVYCFDTSGCVFPQRKFVAQSVYCDGEVNSICECNTFDAYQLSTVIPGGAIDAAYLTLNAGWSLATGIIYNNRIELSANNNSNSTRYNWTLLYSQYPTIESLTNIIASITGNGSSPFNFASNKLPAFDSSEILAPTSTGFTILGGGGTPLASASSFLTFTWNGQETSQMVFPTVYDDTVVATRIQNRLRQLNGLSEIAVDYRRYNAVDFLNVRHFYLTFAGALCGSEQPPVGLGKIGIVSNVLTFNTGNFLIVTPNYEYSWNNHNSPAAQASRNYTRVPSGYPGIVCPYEDASNFSINGEYGFAAFDNAIQCCPQRGGIVGPNQNLPTRYTYGNTNDGYEYTFPYLENTVILDEKCHKIDPFFFLFGEEGRFEDNPHKQYYQTFTRPNCIVPEECDQSVPYNCVEQLFYPAFHKNCPWGVFGGYYYDIEVAAHPNVDTALTFRVGADYAPYGTIRTYGTWQNTTQISINFGFYKRLPFYVGADATIDDRIYGVVATGSVCTGLVLTGNGTSNISLVFDCSGKTIGDFINCINNITTVSDTSGYSEACSIFNFCNASEESLRMPASKINNLTSELFDVWKTYYELTGDTDDPVAFDLTMPGLSPPDDDTYLWSGSDIYPVPKDYSKTLRPQPKLYNNTSTVGTFRQPPPCRYKTDLPQVDYSLNWNSRQTSSFWQAMMGANQKVVTIRRNPASLDLELDDITVSVTGRSVIINGVSGSTIVRSGIFPTDLNGSGYTAYNLNTAINSLSWTPLLGGSAYNPVVSVTGQSFTVWLDDHSWWNSTTFVPQDPYSAGAVKTPLNWSYREPLLDRPPVSIVEINTSIDLKSWIRRRCGWYEGSYASDLLQEEQPRFCIPNEATTFGQGSINCDGDLQVEGNWLASYGCLAEICKTEWYIQAQRCGCNTIENCGESGSVSVENTLVTNSELAPTLYICEQNLRRDCLIPFMIKVPLQTICYSGIDACFDELFYNLSQQCQDYLVDNVPDYEQALTCNVDIPLSYMTFDTYGWCQYIDPVLPTIVRKSEIPRTYPATAYVWERSSTPVCETDWRAVEFFNLDRPGCNYTKYAGIKPWTIYDLVENETACFDPGNLFAHIRAAVSPLIYGDCDRDDIDCSLRCCGCYFTCRDDGGRTCEDNGPYRFCHTTTTQTMSDVTTNHTDVCLITYLNPGDPFPVCSRGGYGPNGGNPGEVSSCFGGFYTTTTTINFTRTNSLLCGCESTVGTATTERSAPNMNCGSCGGCVGYGGCNCPAECNGCNPIVCEVSYGSVTCGTILNDFGYDNTCCNPGCSGTIGPGNIAFCLMSTGITTNVECRTDGRNLCGYGTIENDRTFTEIIDNFAGVGCGQCVNLPPDYTRTTIIDSNINIMSPVCQSCGFTIPNIRNTGYILAYRPSGYCDYPNQLSTTSTGIYN